MALLTDDLNEAFAELRRRRATGDAGWDMAEVRHMPNPPRTAHRYCVFHNSPASREPQQPGEGR